MKTALSSSVVAAILALGASPVLAKATYCQDPSTHKRISCKAAPAAAAMAAPVAAPAAKPSLMSKMTAKKPAAATTTAMAAPAAGHKGKKCGNSYIAMSKTCHKPG